MQDEFRTAFLNQSRTELVDGVVHYQFDLRLGLKFDVRCIGVREARRVHGRYEVNRDDLIAGRVQDDAVAR